MLVDFYHRGSTALEGLVASLSARVLKEGGRMLVVADDAALLTRLDRLLWDQGATSFLPHGIAGESADSRQPILLSQSTDAPNLARHVLVADGIWRDSTLTFDRLFFLFDDESVQSARLAWKLLAGRDGVDRRFWKQDGGEWSLQA